MKDRVLCLALATVFVLGSASPSLAWIADWRYRKPIVVAEQSGSALTDYQIELTVSYVSQMQTDFGDIRFTETDDTEIDYYMEEVDPGVSALFWFEVPLIPASGSTTIYMFYDYIPGTANTTSNGNDTFIHFDDFVRADNPVVGNGWAEVETTSTTAISSTNLFFTPMDDVKRPLAKKTLTALSGGFRWLFYFNWVRTGAEGSYWVYMQIGDSASMDDTQTAEPINADAPSAHTGTGVDLVWYRGASSTHQVLSYFDSSAIQEDLVTTSGGIEIEVFGDIGAGTYDVNVDDTPVKTGAGMNETTTLDEVRFITHAVNQTNFGNRLFGFTYITNYVDPEPLVDDTGAPTLVELSSFTAEPHESGVLLTWETTTEIDTVGFNILRGIEEYGEYGQVNPSLIAAQGEAPGGARYEFVDGELAIGRIYYYKLEALDVSGASELFGPVPAALSGGWSVAEAEASSHRIVGRPRSARTAVLFAILPAVILLLGWRRIALARWFGKSFSRRFFQPRIDTDFRG